MWAVRVAHSGSSFLSSGLSGWGSARREKTSDEGPSASPSTLVLDVIWPECYLSGSVDLVAKDAGKHRLALGQEAWFCSDKVSNWKGSRLKGHREATHRCPSTLSWAGTCICTSRQMAPGLVFVCEGLPISAYVCRCTCICVRLGSGVNHRCLSSRATACFVCVFVLYLTESWGPLWLVDHKHQDGSPSPALGLRELTGTFSFCMGSGGLNSDLMSSWQAFLPLEQSSLRPA